MASRMAVKRLTIEYKTLKESPTPYIEARPSDDDILQWYYVITGPPDTPFAGGQYLGDLKFPPNYPYSPPSIRMLTPSARFEPGSRLCLNMSDFHPESWNPAWNVSTILTGLLSFMCSSDITTGAMQSSPAKQQDFAKRSVKWNLQNSIFTSLFPEICEEIKQAVPDHASVDTIEVIPPKASDLVAKLHTTYRASAYANAVDGARAVRRERQASQAKPPSAAASDPGASPSSQGLSSTVLAIGAVVALILAYALIK